MEPISVSTSPTKEVLVESLIRDVSIEACIFDLIDNAIDAAKDATLKQTATAADGQIYAGYWVKVRISELGVTVTDNCGGMTAEQISSSVLRFGQPSEKDFGIGLYGVGLNRAAFKIGKEVHIESICNKEKTVIDFNVDQYLSSHSWDLPGFKGRSDEAEGTQINITSPSIDSLNVIGNLGTVQEIKKSASELYYFFLNKGFKIFVNEEEIVPRRVTLRQDGPFKNLENKFRFGSDIVIEVIAGQHENHRFSAEPNADKHSNNDLTEDYGWTVICNDRPVILRNRESITGWDKVFHNQFYGFVGYVRFHSKSAKLLPWNTSKTGIDLPNPAYQKALKEMKKFTKHWRKYSEIAKRYQKEKKKLLPQSEQDTPLSPELETTLENPEQNNPEENTNNPKPKKLWAILPEDVTDLKCSDKLRDVVLEAKKCSIKTSRYTCLALMRMLFEMASVDYLMKIKRLRELQRSIAAEKQVPKSGVNLKPMKAADRSKIQPSLSQILDFMKKNPDLWGPEYSHYLTESLNSFSKRKSLLNSGVHHPLHKVGQETVVDVRDEILPILRYLIERPDLPVENE